MGSEAPLFHAEVGRASYPLDCNNLSGRWFEASSIGAQIALAG